MIYSLCDLLFFPLCPLITWEIHQPKVSFSSAFCAHPNHPTHWEVNMQRWVSILCPCSAFSLATKVMLLLWFFSRLLWRYCVIYLMSIHTAPVPAHVMYFLFPFVEFIFLFLWLFWYLYRMVHLFKSFQHVSINNRYIQMALLPRQNWSKTVETKIIASYKLQGINKKASW